jgi:hypothetical protein
VQEKKEKSGPIESLGSSVFTDPVYPGTSRERPPRQEAASFSLDKVMKTLSEGAAGER